LCRNQIISLGWTGEISEQKYVAYDLFHPYSSHFFTQPLDVSSSEQMKNRDEWRLFVQEIKAHPEL
jgi:hypothetical protein